MEEKVQITFTENQLPSVEIVGRDGGKKVYSVGVEAFIRCVAGLSRPKTYYVPVMLLGTDSESNSIWWQRSGVKSLLMNDGGEIVRLKVPMPPLVFRLCAPSGIWVAALAENERPTLDTVLYAAPLPNVGKNGSVCQGNTEGEWVFEPFTARDGLASFWESAFGNHSVDNKCRKYPDDVRLLLYELHGSTVFPTGELVSMEKTITEFGEFHYWRR